MIYNIDTLEKLEELTTTDIKDEQLEINLEFDHYNQELCKKLLYICQYIKNKYTNLNISIGVHLDDSKLLKFSELDGFLNIEEQLKQNDIDLKFGYFLPNNYSLDETINASIHSHDFIEPLKQLNLSPLENFMVIYIILSPAENI